MRRQAEPWETMVLLESLKERWVVSCNGRSQGGKKGMNRNKYGVPRFPGEFFLGGQVQLLTRLSNSLEPILWPARPCVRRRA